MGLPAGGVRHWGHSKEGWCSRHLAARSPENNCLTLESDVSLKYSGVSMAFAVAALATGTQRRRRRGFPPYLLP